MNILISNVYSWQNKGDAAIVLSMLEHLRAEFPDAKITLSTQDRLDTGKYRDCECLPSFISLMKETYGADDTNLSARFRFALAYLAIRLKLALLKVGLRLGLRPYWLFPKAIGQKIQSYEDFDLVVACGGGYLVTTTKPRKLESWLGCRHLRLVSDDFHLAASFDKPFLLYNQSVGPFSSARDARLLKRRLARAAAVICREELTYARLAELGLKNVILSSDVAFNLSGASAAFLEQYGFDTADTNIGITARRCLPGAKQTVYEGELARFIETLLQNDKKSRVFFLPQVIYEEGGDNDLLTAERIVAAVSNGRRHRVTVVTDDVHPSELKSAIGQMDYFIGTRMHSNIFALSSYVKTLAISYEPKTDSIMGMLDLSGYVIAANDVSSQKLGVLFEELKGDTAYVDKLRQRVPEMQARSRVSLREIVAAHG